MRTSRRNRTSRWLAAGAFVLLVLLPGTALAQLPAITPKTSITPTRDTGGWVYWMAEGAIIIGAIILVAVAVSYLRFSPKFFGREEAPSPVAPGARPPLLSRQPQPARQVASSAATPAPSAATSRAAAGSATATAVAERPPPAAASAPAAAASTTTTAPPEGEPAVQADAVGQAETEAPEERPSAKTAEEAGGAAPAAEPAPAAAEPAKEQPGASHGRGELDQETFDRVLKEQLDKGVDRRVAEGRARAAAVVAARKKAQG